MRPGEVVVVGDPRGGRRLVKRVAALEGRQADLRGDDPAASTDSRDLGLIPLPLLVCAARWRYAPASRAGALPAASPAVHHAPPRAAGATSGTRPPRDPSQYS